MQKRTRNEFLLKSMYGTSFTHFIKCMKIIFFSNLFSLASIGWNSLKGDNDKLRRTSLFVEHNAYFIQN